MPTNHTQNTFSSTYKDDFDKTKNFHRVLFNSGRALQARELTQLQTILHNQISSVTGNLFNDGAPITPGSFNCNNAAEFIKVASSTPFPSNPSVLEGLRFENDDSTIKFTIVEAVAAEGDDPDTLYVEYTEDSVGSTDGTRLTAGESFSSIGGQYNFDVQLENTVSNPAVGQGSIISVDEGQFFVQGHVVYCPPQRLVFRKYEINQSSIFGFVVTQDIVTVDDDQTLYDNQGATPNLTSPGADRYRIRLTLADARTTTLDQNFIKVIEVSGGKIVKKTTSSSGFKSIRDEMAIRSHETSGDYVKRYFRASFAPNDNSTFKLKVTPGTAYVKGYRINKDAESVIKVDRPTETFSRNNDSITTDYGNYFLYTSGKSLPDFSNCVTVNLYTGTGGTGTVVGTTKVRAISKFGDFIGTKKIFVFDSKFNEGYSVRDARSIGTGSSNYLTLYREVGQSLTKLYKTDKKPLLFDLPIRRPKSFTDISLTVAKYASKTSTAGGQITITVADAGNALAQSGSWIVASATDDDVDATIAFGSSSTTISGLSASTAYKVLYYERIANASQRQKTLIADQRVTTTLDSDGEGIKFINLGKTDVYEISRCTAYDSDGRNQLGLFGFDNGQRDTHYGVSKLLYNGSGLDSDNQPVYVKFKWFEHSTDGEFFAVNSYDGQVDYVNIPIHRLNNNNTINLRDVADFRPSVDPSSEDFSGGDASVLELPFSGDLVSVDAEYYMPRLDKLVLSKGGELRYIQGVSSMQPKYPSTPVDCIDLYKIEMGANTLHTKDLKTTIIPRRGYTMEDINKLDKRIDKLEQATTLSLLEMNTAGERLFDSDGNERIHTGFFVDNFKNHKFTDTKSLEHRASMDPTKGLVRPGYKERTIPMIYDSGHPTSIGVVQKGDNVYLAHNEVQWQDQLQASKTINVNPFHVEKSLGDLVLSPSKDTYKNVEQDAPLIVDGGTEFDTSQALLWNETSYAWLGTDANDLQVGMSTEPLVKTIGETTTATGEPVTTLVGSEVNVDHGDWVVTGSTTEDTTLWDGSIITGVEHNQVAGDTELKTETTEVAYTGRRINRDMFMPTTYMFPLTMNVKDEIVMQAPPTGWPYIKLNSNHRGPVKIYTIEDGEDSSDINNWTYRPFLGVNTDFSLLGNEKIMFKGAAQGSAHILFSSIIRPQGHYGQSLKGYDVTVGLKETQLHYGASEWQTFDTEKTTTTTDVEVVESVTNTTYKKTDTVTTENQYSTTQEYVTSTDTQTTVNRIVSESVLTEVVDNRELQVIHVPWMRSRKVSFKATNLRPNTRYFPFFNNTDVGNFCKPKTFYKSSTFDDPDYAADESGANMVPEVDLPPALEHSEGKGNLISDENGILEGEFEIPNLVQPPMRFPTGTSVFSLFDISKPDKTKSLSYCSQFYTASGVIESLSGEYTITNTRVLEIVGGQETTTSNETFVTETLSTEQVVTEEVQTDTKTETTKSTIYGDVSTNTIVTDTQSVKVAENKTYDYGQTLDLAEAVELGLTSYEDAENDTKEYQGTDTYIKSYIEADTDNKIDLAAARVYKDEDPTAQSFEVLDPNGIYLTRLRLFFADKPSSDDDQYSVSVAITEAPAGFPDRTRRVPGSFVSLPPGAVKTVAESGASIGQMVANGTDFVFEEPIFLQGNGANYAIIVRSKSMKYKLYISEVEDFLLGSTERRIAKQPTLGSLFVSQNTDVWEPRGKQDLAYVMYRADFVNQGNVYLHNRKVRPMALINNPIRTVDGDNTVTIYTVGHGLRRGDRTRIFGLNANTRYHGILGSSIMGGDTNNSREVISVDATSIKINADSDATVSGKIGGGGVRLAQHIPYESIVPDIDITQPEATNYTLSAKLTRNSSFADSDDNDRMSVDNSFALYKNKTPAPLEHDYAVMNNFEEQSEQELIANSNHSLVSQITFKTSDTRVSPVLDLEATDFKLTSNIIDNTEAAVGDEFLDGEVSKKHYYVSEGVPNEGTVPAKHVTIPINLADTAVGLRVLLSANRPPDTGFRLYWRTCPKDQSISNFAWTPAVTQNAPPADANKNVFREYSYLIGGQEGHIDPFDKFQLKITFASRNSAKVPVIKALRCIALAD
jgi:hypothetical protein